MALPGKILLADALDHLAGRRTLPQATAPLPEVPPTAQGADLFEVKGPEAAKRALKVAAAGGHNLLELCPYQTYGTGHQERPDHRG